jgi:hypothetical protein
MVNVMLASGFPMAVRWGPDFVMNYNDGYRPILGDKHPWGLGLPFREVWPEVQTQLRPLHEAILKGERSAFFACMMQMMVDNLDAWWEHIEALDLPQAFGVQPPRAPAMQSWGLRVGYVWDPAGVLWHVAERRENEPADRAM